MEKILVTGAAGGIGTRMRKLLKGVYPSIRWSDIKKPDDLTADETFMTCDLARMAEVEKIVAGVDGIVHFGGYSIEGPWETILNSNIVGCYNLFEAAHRAGVKRVVFASSVSKAFGEAIGALYADKHGLGVTCIRIGNVGDAPIDQRRLAIWIKPEDLVQLVRIGLEHRDIHFEIFYGVSDNADSWWDNSNARRFGYKPQGQAEKYRDSAMAAQTALLPDPIGDRYQGGTFCSDEYDADKRGG